MNVTALAGAPRGDGLLQRATAGYGPLFPVVLGVCGAGILFAPFSANPLELVVAMVALLVIWVLLWPISPVPSLLAATVAQWLSVTASVLHGSLTGARFERMHQDLPTFSLRPAYFISVLGVVVFALGVRLGGKQRVPASQELPADGMQLVWAYGVFRILLLPVIVLVAHSVPGLQQPLLISARLQWVIFALMFEAHVRREIPRYIVPTIAGIEVILGFASFFASFKEFIILTLILAIGAMRVLRVRTLVVGALAFVLLFELGAFWSAIKTDYRGYLNQGSKAFVVSVDKTDALARIGGYVAKYDLEQREEGIHALIRREVYIDFFSSTMDTVPNEVAYEEGKVWAGAITHVLLPRLFFPDKEVVDDTAQTLKYTQVEVTSGTSVSMGYGAESYVDFGFPGMLVPILLLGWVISRTQRAVVEASPSVPVAIALGLPVFFACWGWGARASKVLGDVLQTAILYLIVLWAGRKYLARRATSIVRASMGSRSTD